MGGERKIVAQFDKNGDKRLDAAERKEARSLSRIAADGTAALGVGARVVAAWWDCPAPS